MGLARDAILNNTFPTYIRTFFDNYFILPSTVDNDVPTVVYPNWCVDALRSVGVDLMEATEGSANRVRKVKQGNGAKWE